MIRTRVLTQAAVLSLCLVIVACTELPPRSFTEFVEDAAARDGTLLRCNADRQATINDIECANARRAAAAVALEVERARRAELEAESDRLRSELRDRIASQQQAEREAEELRRAMQQAAYEAQWDDPQQPEPASQPDPFAGTVDATVIDSADELSGAPSGGESVQSDD